MMTMLTGKTPTSRGPVAVATEPLGRGGEGSVYALEHHGLEGLPPAEGLVAKIYHDPLEGDRRAKVSAMILAPPGDDAVAWPQALLLDSSGMFQGYLMKRVDPKGNLPWASLAHTAERRAAAPAFDVRYGLTAARNLAVAINAVHLAGHRVGDVNESNIFVAGDASVLLVDTDSAQIAGKGKTFPCPVGKPEYTSPELTHGSLRDQQRTVESDLFAHAVATFQMMTGGAHPTDGIFTGAGDPPSVVDKIRSGTYPSLDAKQPMRPPARIPWKALPSRLRASLLKALSVEPAKRGSLGDLALSMEDIIGSLKQCGRVKQHWFDPRDGECGWCAHAASGQGDPWGPVAPRPKQNALPPVGFSQPGAAAPARRAPAAPAQGLPIPAWTPPPLPGPQPTASWPPVSAPRGPSGPAVPGPSPAPPPPRSPFRWAPKTILTNPAGVRIVRPAWGVFFKQDAKLAWQCLRSELPDVLKFWPARDRGVPQPLALLVGMALSFMLSILWMKFSDGLPNEWYGRLFNILAVGAAATGAFTAIALGVFGSAAVLRDTVGRGTTRNNEAVGLTVARFIGCALAYGPFLVLGLTYALVSGAVSAIMGEIRR